MYNVVSSRTVKNVAFGTLFSVFAVVGTIAILKPASADTLSVASLANSGLEGPFVPVETKSDKSQITGTTAKGWKDHSGWADVTVNYSEETSNVHEGKSAQKIEVTDVRKGVVQLIQELPSLTSGHQYTASVWVRASESEPIVLNLCKRDAPYTKFAEQTIPAGTTWQKVTLTGTATEDTAATLAINVKKPSTVWADDAILTDATATRAAAAAPAVAPKTVAITDIDAPASGAIVLKNSSLEDPFVPVDTKSDKSQITGVTAKNWHDHSGWADVTVNYSEETANVHEGKAAQKIEVKDIRKGVVQLIQELPILSSGHQYKASVWVRASESEPIVINLCKRDAPYTKFAEQTITAGDGWQQVTLTGTATEDTAATLAINVKKPSTVWADDAVLNDVTGTKTVASVPGN